ncbi:MAG: hypothetical protein ACOC3F_03370 [Desulfosudaceae bacterium]
MTTTTNIQTALADLLGEEPLLPQLARVLDRCRQEGGLTFGEIAGMAGEEAAEVVLLAWDWKLLLPRRSRQCAEWDDRVMRFETDEYYLAPNLVRCLLDRAAAGGAWEQDAAVAGLYRQMGEADWEKMPALVAEIAGSAGPGGISGAAIGRACVRAGLGDRVGAMIAVLKGGGVISPRLVGAGPGETKGSPVYEVHPAVTGR